MRGPKPHIRAGSVEVRSGDWGSKPHYSRQWGFPKLLVPYWGLIKYCHKPPGNQVCTRALSAGLLAEGVCHGLAGDLLLLASEVSSAREVNLQSLSPLACTKAPDSV